MRRPIVVALLLTLLTASCALPTQVYEPKQVKQRVTEEVAPAEMPPAASTQDVTGTTWTVTYYDTATSEEYVYDVTFLPGGALLDGHPNNSTFENDRWEQLGSTVIMYINDAYATHTGEIAPAGVMSGTATNVTGSTWPWSAVLTAEEPPPAAAGDVTGTTWTKTYYDDVTAEDYVYEITFLPGGELLDGHPNNTTFYNDRWEQVGATITLYINDGYATYTGEISGGTMSGTATNVTGSTWPWSAVLND